MGRSRASGEARMVAATLVFSKPPGAKASEAAKALWSQHLGFAHFTREKGGCVMGNGGKGRVFKGLP